MIIEIHDVWEESAGPHEVFLRQAVTSAVQRELALVGPLTLCTRAVIEFIDRHLDVLADSSTRDFTAIVQDFHAVFDFEPEFLEQAKDKFKKIFNYTSFTNDRVGWGAYALCSRARYAVCPYCHMTSIRTVPADANNVGYRPQLDHYYDKGRYPFLALSLGNLVPSCGTCNGPGMKHMKDFTAIPHLNPLRDAPVLSFGLVPANGGTWSPELRALRVPAASFEVRITVPVGNERATNSLHTFQLQSRYQPKLPDAYRVAKLGLSPAFARSASLATGLDVHNMTVAEHLGFDPNGSEYKNKPEGKMLLDVYSDSSQWLGP